MNRTMTKAELEDELRGYFLSYAADVGEQGVALAEFFTSKSSSSAPPGPHAAVLAIVRQGRRIRRALNQLPNWQRGILEACYSDASTYQIPLNVDRMKPAAVFCARAKAKSTEEKRRCGLQVERAHDAYSAARERDRVDAAVMARAAREIGQMRRAFMLEAETEVRLDRDAWTDLERDAWLEELGLPSPGQRAQEAA